MAQGRTIYLSMGSNLGDRAADMRRAVEALGPAGVRVARQSSLYVTEPVDFPAQHWFLNCVLEAETNLMPRQLLHAVQEIERALGRKKMVRGDRKSTRLNSSHLVISYAVFCLKKKKKNREVQLDTTQ